MVPRSTTFGTEVLPLPGNNLACVLLKKLSSFDVFCDETPEACPGNQTLSLLQRLVVAFFNGEPDMKTKDTIRDGGSTTIYTVYTVYNV